MTDTTFGPLGWTPERLGSLCGKTFVITGATSGTGLETARTLLSKGGRVIMLNRNPEKSDAVIQACRQDFGQDIKVSAIQMDLSDLKSIRRAGKELLTQAPRIDALICNAAIAQVPRQKLTIDGFESQLGTNHYGHFLLCGLVFDRIDQSEGRIVVVASLGYKMGLRAIQFDDMNWDGNYHQNRTYCHSKLAQMMFAYALQDRIKAAGRSVDVYVCHPGASRTSLIKTNANLLSRVLFAVFAVLPIAQSAQKGAYPALMCATENGLAHRAFYGPTGLLEMVGPVGQGTLEAYATDQTAMDRLWNLSEKATEFDWGI